MTTLREALQFSLGALEYAGEITEPEGEHGCNCLICQATILAKEALAQPEQEPCCYGGIAHDCRADENCRIVKRMKAAQKPPQRKPLTDEQLKPICDEYRILFGSWVVDFARAIEAAHGIKVEA